MGFTQQGGQFALFFLQVGQGSIAGVGPFDLVSGGPVVQGELLGSPGGLFVSGFCFSVLLLCPVGLRVEIMEPERVVGRLAQRAGVSVFEFGAVLLEVSYFKVIFIVIFGIIQDFLACLQFIKGVEEFFGDGQVACEEAGDLCFPVVAFFEERLVGLKVILYFFEQVLFFHNNVQRLEEGSFYGLFLGRQPGVLVGV